MKSVAEGRTLPGAVKKELWINLFPIHNMVYNLLEVLMFLCILPSLDHITGNCCCGREAHSVVTLGLFTQVRVRSQYGSSIFLFVA